MPLFRRTAIGLALLGLLVSATASAHVHADATIALDDCAVCAHAKSHAVVSTDVVAVEIPLIADRLVLPSVFQPPVGSVLRSRSRAPPSRSISLV